MNILAFYSNGSFQDPDGHQANDKTNSFKTW